MAEVSYNSLIKLYARRFDAETACERLEDQSESQPCPHAGLRSSCLWWSALAGLTSKQCIQLYMHLLHLYVRGRVRMNKERNKEVHK